MFLIFTWKGPVLCVTSSWNSHKIINSYEKKNVAEWFTKNHGKQPGFVSLNWMKYWWKFKVMLCLFFHFFFPLTLFFCFSFKGPQGPQGPVGFPGPKGPNVSSCCQRRTHQVHIDTFHISFSNINTHLRPCVFYELSTCSPPGPSRKRWTARSPWTEGRDGEWVVSSMNALCRAIWPSTSCIIAHSLPTQPLR